MAKVLTTDEMIDALNEINPDAASQFRDQLVTLADAVAEDLANQLGIATSGASNNTWEGTMAIFKPAHDGQPMPDVLKDYDEGGEWDD